MIHEWPHPTPFDDNPEYIKQSASKTNVIINPSISKSNYVMNQYHGAMILDRNKQSINSKRRLLPKSGNPDYLTVGLENHKSQKKDTMKQEG